jgi:membrane-bound lytic murein transglycosylase A
MRRPRFLATIFLVLIVPLAAALFWWWTKPAPIGRFGLSPATFSELPGWDRADLAPALAAFRRSCGVLLADDPDVALGYAGTAGEWHAPCRAALEAKDARAFFEGWFAPMEVGGGDSLFTGYYEPELRASRTRHDAYQTPIYARPADLVSVDLGRFRDDLKGKRIAGRVAGHDLVPYAPRAEIDAKGLGATPVLFYADDPVAAFFLHIQGSGRVALDDGTAARVQFDGQNGHVYTAIGRTLIAQGALKREDVSLQSIRAWLEAHPDRARQVMESDASYVFFKEAPLGDPALASPGAEAVPLTPRASIAVDLGRHPLGAPFYIAASYPSGDPLERLFVAQDTGGAIVGPVRADIFFGFGADAEKLAGRMKQKGRMYVLLPKPIAQRLARR